MSSRLALLALAASAFSVLTASASDEGQWIVGQVDQASYRHYLADVLYTHDGNNRQFGRPDHAAARVNIVDTFTGFGLDVRTHAFSEHGFDGLNIVATQWGQTDPDLCFVVGAHYDSYLSPGADDDASGVAALLELARVTSQYPFGFTIVYVAFDLEEYGLLGSRAYVEDHDLSQILGMIQLDMIAYNDGRDGAEIYGRRAYQPHKVALKAAFERYVPEITVQLRRESDGSDHAPFEWAGVPACALAEPMAVANPCYHTACDSVDQPDYIDYAYAASMTRGVAGFLADQAIALVCPGDLDGNWAVDISDVAGVLAHFGESGPASAGDADADGDTDEADLDLVIGRFGEQCDRPE